MNSPFCQNVLCRWNKALVEPEITHMRAVLADGTEVKFRRLRIVDVAAKKELTVCEICANAIALVNQPSNETLKPLKHENTKEEPKQSEEPRPA